MKRNADISDFLIPLDSASTQSYLTNVLQVADVLDWVLKQFGKSEIWQTSFSFSEEFIRRLYFIGKKGCIANFNLILDRKATAKTVKLWHFLKQVINNCWLADNHSKIMLIKSQNGKKAAILTSQNLTRGNRSESAIITTDNAIFNTLFEQLQDLIINHSIPFNEFVSRTTPAD